MNIYISIGNVIMYEMLEKSLQLKNKEGKIFINNMVSRFLID